MSDSDDDFAREERARREAASIEKRREEARHFAKSRCVGCADYALGGHTAIWGPPDALVDGERRRELNPMHESWPAANAAYSVAWVREWVPIADTLRDLGDVEAVRARCPSEPRDRRMHELFVLLLDRAPVETVAERLASLRAKMEPTIDEWRALRGVHVGARFELARYFRWLQVELVGLWAPPETVKPAGIPLAPQQRRFRDILLEQPPGEALTGPQVCALYLSRHREYVEPSDFRSHVVPALKAIGLRNDRRRGYHFPSDAQARRAQSA